MAKTVLIVDDNIHVRRAVCDQFKREEALTVCREGANGREAIAKALELHPDLVVLNLLMPVMNGLDAARDLKDRMPSVPIILFAFYVDLFVKEAALPSGVSDVVSKSEPLSALITNARSLLYRNAA
jgi:DNA-binding NarL/FixJ family response regulator